MQSFRRGIMWFLLSLLISVINDSVIKYLSPTLSAQIISFYRFLFATLSMLPIILAQRSFSAFTTSRLPLHLLRGGILFAAMFLWCTGLTSVKITYGTLLSFTVPIFVLILAPVFLKERVSLHLWLATILCFLGIFVIVGFGTTNYDYYVFYMLLAAFLFATLDIINKRFVMKESILGMLFYSNLVTTILGFIFFELGGIVITLHQYGLLLLLGLGANGILYTLLKAFRYINASQLAPYRYLELVFSFLSGYLLFGESVNKQFCIGAIMIIIATLYVSFRQAKSNIANPL